MKHGIIRKVSKMSLNGNLNMKAEAANLSRQKRPRNVKEFSHKVWISVRWLQIWRLTGIHLPYKLFILLGRKSEGGSPLIPPSFPSPSPNPHRLVQGTHDSWISSICLPHTGLRPWCSFLRIQHFQYVFLTNIVFFFIFFFQKTRGAILRERNVVGKEMKNGD